MTPLCRCLAALAFTAAPAAAACDLALILAIDVSGSVDETEYRIQTRGLAEALRDGIVSEALVVAEAQVAVIQWTGKKRQAVSIPWREIRSFDDLEALATQVDTMPRKWRNFATAIGEALELSLETFASGPTCRRRVVDVSGDGRSNEGVRPDDTKPDLEAAGVTVNALVIEGSEPDLTSYFREQVISGPGAFALSANGYEDYPNRIRTKLRRETARPLSHLKLPETE